MLQVLRQAAQPPHVPPSRLGSPSSPSSVSLSSGHTSSAYAFAAQSSTSPTYEPASANISEDLSCSFCDIIILVGHVVLATESSWRCGKKSARAGGVRQMRPPGRGDCWILKIAHAPSPKNLSKNGLPQKGGSLSAEGVLAKKFQAMRMNGWEYRTSALGLPPLTPLRPTSRYPAAHPSRYSNGRSSSSFPGSPIMKRDM
jgi:hypothetical protein